LGTVPASIKHNVLATWKSLAPGNELHTEMPHIFVVGEVGANLSSERAAVSLKRDVEVLQFAVSEFPTLRQVLGSIFWNFSVLKRCAKSKKFSLGTAITKNFKGAESHNSQNKDGMLYE